MPFEPQLSVALQVDNGNQQQPAFQDMPFEPQLSVALQVDYTPLSNRAGKHVSLV